MHPPQARLVGELIASSPEEKQIFIATHSIDVLQGLMSSFPERVSVIRLQRGGEGPAFLQNSDLAKLWKDPILRYSNVLNGLFHSGVIITEADADCRFYEAMGETTTISPPALDIHFTYSGGKARLSLLVKALRALSVKVVSITDIDVLSDLQPLRDIVEAHGGDWAAYEADWKFVKQSVEGRRASILGKDFRDKLSALMMNLADDQVVPKSLVRTIKDLIRNATPWDYIKASGLAAVPPGQPNQRAVSLLAALREIGIFVVPNGEMEGFCRTVGGHGPRWVESVLEQRDIFSHSELHDARAFMKLIKTHLSPGASAVAATGTLLRPVALSGSLARTTNIRLGIVDRFLKLLRLQKTVPDR